jgi:CheY-like chemotaxis protein
MDAPSANPTSRPNARILIADDDAGVRSVVSQVLQELGYETLTAGDGDEALMLARERRPDLIVLDLMMPGRGGIETCQRLRADLATRNIPVLVFSGLDAQSALEESIIAGADDFLTKPVNTFELTVRVRSMLATRNIRDDDKRLEAYIKTLREMRERGGRPA